MPPLIFFDIDTQVDFVDPQGSLYVPGSQAIAGNIRKLLEHATAHRITTISPMCAHVVDDPEFQQFAPHCIEGTNGQRRYFEALPQLPRRIWMPEATVGPDQLEVEPGHHYVVEKRSFPMFVNPWMHALRQRGVFAGVHGVAFGVATDVCVRVDVLDLCHAGARVELVRDAIAGIDAQNSARAIAELTAAGARLVTTEEILRRT